MKLIASFVTEASGESVSPEKSDNPANPCRIPAAELFSMREPFYAWNGTSHTVSTQTKTVTRTASEIVAAIAMIILLIYIADAVVANAGGREDGTGFLPMSEALRGMIFGTSSIVLFLVAFGMNIKARSRITATLLIVGGAITGTAVLAASAMSEGGLGSISGSFLGVIIVGYIIMGLGIWQAMRKGTARPTRLPQ